jgi:hypothetical protein
VALGGTLIVILALNIFLLFIFLLAHSLKADGSLDEL